MTCNVVQRLPEPEGGDGANNHASSLFNLVSDRLQQGVANVEENSCVNNNSCNFGIALPDRRSELALDGSGIKELNNGVKVSPSPGFVVKSISCSLQRKIFINVCSSDAVAEPQNKIKLDNDGNEVSGLNVPIAVGTTRICKDHAGCISIAVDCIVHPVVVQKVQLDASGEYRDFVCQLVIHYVEQKFPDIASIDKKYKLPRLKYQGYVDRVTGDVVAQNHVDAVVVTQWVRDIRSQPKIEEISKPIRKENYNSHLKNNVLESQENYASKRVFRARIELYVELTDKTLSPILDFLQERFRRVDVCEKDGKETPLDYLTPKTVLFEIPENNEENLHNSQLFKEPFLADPPDDIEHMVIHVCLSREAVSSAVIQLSAGICKISADGFITTTVVLPFWVNTKSATCIRSSPETSGLLVVRIQLCRNSLMCDTPDPGSRPWMLTEALKNGSNVDSTRTAGSGARRSFIGPLMPQNDPIFDELVHECADDMQLELPEDKFHAQDMTSRYMLEMQEKGREAKSAKADANKSNVEVKGNPKEEACTNSAHLKDCIGFTVACPYLKEKFPFVFASELGSRLLMDSDSR